MPRVKQHLIRSMFVDSIFLFALFTMVGNITLHFWERYAVQNEIVNIKQTVHNLKVQSLQDTLHTIGKAYDQLHEDLKDVFKHVDQNQIRQCEECKTTNLKQANVYDMLQKDINTIVAQYMPSSLETDQKITETSIVNNKTITKERESNSTTNVTSPIGS